MFWRRGGTVRLFSLCPPQRYQRAPLPNSRVVVAVRKDLFVSLVANLYRRFAHLVHELAKFGSVGAIAFVITFGLGNGLHTGLGMGPLSSNGIATVVATTFAYVAN